MSQKAQRSLVAVNSAVGSDRRRVTLRLLGGFRLDVGGTPVHLSAAGQRLVALLALRGPTTRQHAAGTIWPESTDSHAHGCLRSTLWRLARIGSLVESGSYGLRLVPDVWVDVAAYRSWATMIVRIARSSTLESTPLDLVGPPGGELLPGWYDDFLDLERDRLRQLRLHAAEASASLLCAEERYAEAIDVALEAVGIDPYRESAHRTLVLVHLAEGNVREAIARYEHFRALLHAELGLTPSASFQALLPTVRAVPQLVTSW